MRLIDADANIETMKKCAENPENEQALLCYRYAQRILEEAPTVPAAPRWVRCEEKPKDRQECFVAYKGPLGFIYESAIFYDDLNSGLYEDIFEDGTSGFVLGGEVGYALTSMDYWMPIEPPREDA